MHNCLVCLFFLLVNLIFAVPNEDTVIRELDELEVQQLIEKNDAAVLRVESDRVFIRPEKIFPTETGLLLKTSDRFFVINELRSSSRGCYVSRSEPDAIIYPLITCRNCQKVFNPNIYNRGKCPRCGCQN